MLLTNLNAATMRDHYGLIEDAAILIEDGRIAWVGPRAEAPSGMHGINCQGRLVTPGLIDCHTHLVYGGNRAHEFEMRLGGIAYADIAKSGGGIASTVRATRTQSEGELVASALKRLDALLAEGITTVEIKSGYGLDERTELKMLRVVRELDKLRPVDVAATYLGAHAIPPEFHNDREGYVKLICEQVIPAVVKFRLADAVDAFCEKIAFTVEETARVFEAARAHGLRIKLHAEQLSNLGGAKMAASFNALSVDHIEYLDDSGVEAIAKSGTVAVLLPGAFYYLREKQAPPVAALRHHGVPMAIATDLNPGSSPIHSILTTMNMACVLFGLRPDEALRGVTVNGARALGLNDRGMIVPGMKADLAIWDAERPGDLCYPIGYNPLTAVIKNGKTVRGTLS
ncbi:imidazolonepropionase [Aestuariivirga sp.]|uniref:imidazolonepropionase n=1 Tax=Aestuariivirga sp. TaxID=2650926 RepID=UPI0035947115